MHQKQFVCKALPGLAGASQRNQRLPSWNWGGNPGMGKGHKGKGGTEREKEKEEGKRVACWYFLHHFQPCVHQTP